VLRPLIFAVAALASGCASLDRDECRSADWYAIGLEDGARGRPLERLGDHRRACAEYGIAPEAQRYLAGREEGLKSFCTYERGFAHGKSGHGYSGGCPAALARNFQAGYQLGRELHDLERRHAEVQREIAKSKARLAEGLPGARSRAAEVDRLEDLTRESVALEARIQGMTQR
jgi:hypothetical protein